MKIDEKVDVVALVGAAGMGLCPVLIAGALASVGLGVLVPLWIWLSAGFLVIGVAGFWLDYRQHRQILPLLLFTVGGTLLFVGRYTRYGGTGWEGWEIWGPGTVLVVAAFIRNLQLRRTRCPAPLQAENPSQQ